MLQTWWAGIRSNRLEWLGKAILFTPGTFFCYPYKPLLLWLSKATYRKSYKHFRAGHADGLNLGLHVACLLLQLIGNFAFLAALDTALLHPEMHPLGFSNVTLALWFLALITTRSPVSVRAGSLFLMVVAHQLRYVVLGLWEPLALAQAVPNALTLWYISRVFFERQLSWLSRVLLLISCCALHTVVSAHAGMLQDYRAGVTCSFLLLLAISSQVICVCA